MIDCLKWSIYLCEPPLGAWPVKLSKPVEEILLIFLSAICDKPIYPAPSMIIPAPKIRFSLFTVAFGIKL